MKLSVIGAGYVGLVTAACFADRGRHVIGVDAIQEEVRGLSHAVVLHYGENLRRELRTHAALA